MDIKFWMYTAYLMWASGDVDILSSEKYDNLYWCNQYRTVNEAILEIMKNRGELITYNVNECKEYTDAGAEPEELIDGQ